MVPNAEAAMSLLAHGPLQPRADRSSSKTPADRSASSARHRPARTATASAPHTAGRRVEYRDERVSLQADTEGGYLVLADAYYPGWRAYVDGEETPVLRGDYLFRAGGAAGRAAPGAIPLSAGELRDRAGDLAPDRGTGRLALLITLGPAARVRRPTWLRTP